MRLTARLFFTPAFSLLAVLALAPASHAEVWGGVRGGFSFDPDQVNLGGQLEFDPVADNLYIVPSGELGLGDDAFTLSFNGDLQYRFQTQGKVRPFLGGGLTLFFIDYDRNRFGSSFGGDDSATDLGVSFVGGIMFRSGSGHPMFVEARLALTDEIPDGKIMFAVNF